MNLKENWPLLVVAIVGLLGLVLLMQGSGGSGGEVASGGLTGAQEASLLTAQNTDATQIQEAEIAANASDYQTQYGDVLGAVQDIYSTSAALQADQYEDAAQEYEAYEQELGTALGYNAQVSEASIGANVQTQQSNTLAALYQQLGMDSIWQSIISGATSIGAIFAKGAVA